MSASFGLQNRETVAGHPRPSPSSTTAVCCLNILVRTDCHVINPYFFKKKQKNRGTPKGQLGHSALPALA